MIIPNEGQGLNKKRHLMPQISDYNAFIADLESEGVDVTTVMIKASRLTPTQSNFNEDKVNRMIEDESWKRGAIVSSKDDCVLDGHHRWLAAAQDDSSIRTRRIGMNIEDLLAFVKDKSYVEYKKINEARQWAN
ncbi:hypothetical protein CPT_Mendera_053 [Stenotrophomonas phage Mendera]|uniref:ParB/Sulfiredoxin domain-containing protein n=3 Tax=Menderavirus TaxID=2843421 RepID=A0A0H4ISI3_9CAUD|nr:hypothetical protein HWC11_gp058 [Stenotrophomonas phage YB07]YP_009851110.1 hypothetical protein HWC60_gp053 [Stenotrophomonas phage Mendera]YP_010077894.1 hypothetical protein KMC40_gp057 [Stenotrophomonas phage IME-SM1]QXN67427.1 hypothetical protein [Stenotrophomonas phage BUCT608]QYW02600.1 virion-associated protein [Stenotrophomonas phage Marzo]AKO61701.1 hypothetical protein [Stenotrophomonas phage IME-SM1]QBP06254.1 hypothetical protein [Stenotrophomonas phage YB07]QFR56602.1 hypo